MRSHYRQLCEKPEAGARQPGDATALKPNQEAEELDQP